MTVLLKGNGWYQITGGGLTGFMSAGYLRNMGTTGGGSGTVTTRTAYVNNPRSTQVLYLRETPSQRARALGQYKNGTQVKVVSYGATWCEVYVGTRHGYMMTRYLAEDASAVQDMTKEMQVVSPYGTQSVVVRNTPSNSYDAVAMAEVGDEVRVIGTKGDYYYVLLGDGSVGCLSTSEAN